MSATVSFDNVSYSGLLDNFSFKITTGTCALIITAREEESFLLAGLMAGLKLPASGSVNVSGCPTSNSTQEALFQLRSQIGIIPFSGGLVSNLKVWENIFLPYLYHYGEPTSLDEEVADNYLKELDYTGKKMALPAHLTIYEKRVVAFIRAAVMKPRIMIYCNTFDKISQSQQEGLASVIDRYHSECAERTSIFFASSAKIPFINRLDTVIPIHGQ